MEYENSTCEPLQLNTESGNKLSEFSLLQSRCVYSAELHTFHKLLLKQAPLSGSVSEFLDSFRTLLPVWKSLGLTTAFKSNGKGNKDGTYNCEL